MPTVTLSPKFQVVIPREVRKARGLRVGQPVEAFAFDGRIELVPVRPLAEQRGLLRGIDTTVPP